MQQQSNKQSAVLRRARLMRAGALILLAFVAALGVGARSTALAAPLAQGEQVEILARGFVDLFGGSDPSCPGCDGNYDPEDEQAAMDDPLPELTFEVKDKDGNVVATETTTSLAGLQRVAIMVPKLADGDFYTLELAGDPSGWQLCSSESASRQLPSDVFATGGTIENFHFFKGCQAPQPTAGPTAEPTQGGPEPQPTMAPPAGGDSDGKHDDDEDHDGDGGGQPPAPPMPAGAATGNGSIKGLVFIDLGADGALGPSDPGLGGAQVFLHGMGIDTYMYSEGSGQFSFDSLPPGEYDVFIQTDYRITTRRTYHVRLDNNVVMGNDFGLVRPAGAASSGRQAARGARGPRLALPSTGLADLPQGGLLGGIGLALFGLVALGLAGERRGRRR